MEAKVTFERLGSAPVWVPWDRYNILPLWNLVLKVGKFTGNSVG